MRAIAVFIGLILLGAAAYATETINYSYDNSGELIGVARTGTVSGNTVNVTTTYTYDHAENRNVMNTQ